MKNKKEKHSHKIAMIEEKIRSALFDLTFEEYEPTIGLLAELFDYLNLCWAKALAREELEDLKNTIDEPKLSLLKKYYEESGFLDMESAKKNKHLWFLVDKRLLGACDSKAPEGKRVLFVSITSYGIAILRAINTKDRAGTEVA